MGHYVNPFELAPPTGVSSVWGAVRCQALTSGRLAEGAGINTQPYTAHIAGFNIDFLVFL